MRVLVTGAGGQLGQDLVEVFARDEVTALGHADLDVGHEPAVAAVVADLRPDLVVNAAAWTDVDGCEADPDRAHRDNALGPWWLARACARQRARLVTFSTDYVFDGVAPTHPDGSPRPWGEFDAVAPLNAYGRSKAAGEALVRQSLDEHVIIRTAWVCGARGGNFVRTMLRVGPERGRVDVVDDQIGSPTFTRELAAATREVAVSGRPGTYHRTSAGRCSFFELARATFELAGLDVEVAPISSAELDRPAPRPAWSVLDDRHSVASGLRPMAPWREGLERLLEELDALRSS